MRNLTPADIARMATEREARSHLDPAIVRGIRSRHREGYSNVALAHFYEVSEAVIDAVVKRKVWGHVK